MRTKVAILGSGPAGLTAAIYCARAMLEPLVIEGDLISNADQPGGQLMLTTDIENYPGFVNGIGGPELIATFKQQAARFGATFLPTRVTQLKVHQRPFELTCSNGEEILADTVIVATGARSLMLGIPGEERFLGKGLSTCATCDGFFFKDKKIVVVGGGDSAMEEALFLTRFASELYVIHRRSELRASKIMQNRAFSNPKISFLFNTRVLALKGHEKLEALQLIDNDKEYEFKTDALFVAIGHRPATEIFDGILDMDENGYLKTYKRTQTSVEGIFAAGDVQDDWYRQAITAAGSGCQAAIDAERYLEAEKL
jgi:thioredoxin reductase (NADPH)